MAIKKHIGLVLTKPPVYSETFITHKINGLIANGYRVTVFSNAYKKGSFPYRLVCAWSPQPRARVILSAPILLYCCIRYFRSLYRYYTFTKKETGSSKYAMKYLVSNFHILTNPVDQLHFEFAGLAINRETVAKAMGCKMSVSIRGYDVAIQPLTRGEQIQKIWKYVDEVHSISDDITLKAYRAGMSHDMNVVKIHPAIDTSAYTPKEELGTVSKPIKLMSVGRFHWKKGYDYTFAALRILKEQGVDFIFTLVGAGKQQEELLFLTKKLGLQDCIHFVGQKNPDEVIEILRQHDIYIQFSVQEGFGNAVLEAQSAGLLVVASDAEGLQENVLHENTGWIVPRRSIYKLAQQIMDICEMDEQQRRNIVIKASDRVKSNFDIVKQNTEFDHFFGK